jgi:HAD superfamily hydrolase (TIGR01450 family)
MRWVFDLDGVVWLSGKSIPGSSDAIARLRRRDDVLAFVTNNSTPAVADHVAALGRVGISAHPEEIVTSAQAAATLIQPGTRVAMLGGPGVREALTLRGIEIVPVDQDPAAVVVGRSLTLDFGELAQAASAIRAGATFIATNTDSTFPTPDGLEPGAGALVAYLEVGSGRRATAAGKPESAMAHLVTSRFGVPEVVVGDRSETDGRFAELLGSKFALVLTGVTTRHDLPVHPEPALVAENLFEVVTHYIDS